MSGLGLIGRSCKPSASCASTYKEQKPNRDRFLYACFIVLGILALAGSPPRYRMRILTFIGVVLILWGTYAGLRHLLRSGCSDCPPPDADDEQETECAEIAKNIALVEDQIAQTIRTNPAAVASPEERDKLRAQMAASEQENMSALSLVQSTVDTANCDPSQSGCNTLYTPQQIKMYVKYCQYMLQQIKDGTAGDYEMADYNVNLGAYCPIIKNAMQSSNADPDAAASDPRGDLSFQDRMTAALKEQATLQAAVKAGDFNANGRLLTVTDYINTLKSKLKREDFINRRLAALKKSLLRVQTAIATGQDLTARQANINQRIATLTKQLADLDAPDTSGSSPTNREVAKEAVNAISDSARQFFTAKAMMYAEPIIISNSPELTQLYYKKAGLASAQESQCEGTSNAPNQGGKSFVASKVGAFPKYDYMRRADGCSSDAFRPEVEPPQAAYVPGYSYNDCKAAGFSTEFCYTTPILSMRAGDCACGDDAIGFRDWAQAGKCICPKIPIRRS